MFQRLRLCAAALAFLAPAMAGCGGGSDYQPTTGHSGMVGRDGGHHALGSDPKAEETRIRKARTAASAPTPGSLPGR